MFFRVICVVLNLLLVWWVMKWCQWVLIYFFSLMVKVILGGCFVVLEVQQVGDQVDEEYYFGVFVQLVEDCQLVLGGYEGYCCVVCWYLLQLDLQYFGCGEEQGDEYYCYGYQLEVLYFQDL